MYLLHRSEVLLMMNLLDFLENWDLKTQIDVETNKENGLQEIQKDSLKIRS